MRITFLNTIPNRNEINNLISDISSNVKNTDFHFFNFPYLGDSFLYLVNLLKLKRFIKKNKIDVIHVYDYVDAYWVSKIINKAKTKIVFSEYYYHDELSGFRNHIYEKVLSKVDYILFQTESHKNYMMNFYKLNPDKCSKLFHAFCLKRFDDCEYSSVRDEFFIEDLKYLIGTTGDFTPQRSMMSVFRMIKKLRRSGRNFMCVVAGEQIDEYETYYNSCKYYYLMQGLDNYITYIGRRDDTANLLSQLDLFVYSSDKETVAIPVIEAMISGVNVVANDCDMIREITHNGKYAVLYEDNNENDFAIKTRAVLTDLEDYKLISQVVKEETRQIFSIERHITSLKNIYSKVIQ